MSGYIPLLLRAFQRRLVFVSGLSRRIMKMATMRPDEVLLQLLPSPPSANAHLSAVGPSSLMSVCEDSRPYQPLYASKNRRTLQTLVMLLSQRLRMCYPKRIEWPAEQPSPYVS
jgi:hypothetical protein